MTLHLPPPTYDHLQDDLRRRMLEQCRAEGHFVSDAPIRCGAADNTYRRPIWKDAIVAAIHAGHFTRRAIRDNTAVGPSAWLCLQELIEEGRIVQNPNRVRGADGVYRLTYSIAPGVGAGADTAANAPTAHGAAFLGGKSGASATHAAGNARRASGGENMGVGA